MPRRAQIAMEPSSTTAAKSGEASVTVPTPRARARKYAAKAPTMYTSPCAKLMRRRVPYTMVYPSAIRA